MNPDQNELIPRNLIEDYLDTILEELKVRPSWRKSKIEELIKYFQGDYSKIAKLSLEEVKYLLIALKKSNYIRVRSINNQIKRVRIGTSLKKLILFYSTDPRILYHPNLQEVHRTYLKAFFSSVENGIYDSLELISRKHGLQKGTFSWVIEDAFTRITGKSGEDFIYFKANGSKVSGYESRLKLLDLYNIPEFVSILRPEDLRLVTLLIETTDNRFCYSYSDIAKLLSIDSHDAEQVITARVFRLIEKSKRLDSIFLDENGSIIKKKHLALLKLLHNNTLLPGKLNNSISRQQRLILSEILRTSNNGTYQSYYKLSQQFECSVQNISHHVRIILKKATELLED